MSMKVGAGRKIYRGRSMKVAEAGMPSENKITDGKVRKDPSRSKNG
jgi:hypothetical protein